MSGSLLERAGAAQADARAKRDQTAIRRIGLVVNDGKREALEAAGIVERGPASTACRVQT
jgi:hypothetical protein